MQDPNLPWGTSADDIDRALAVREDDCGGCLWCAPCVLADGGEVPVCTRAACFDLSAPVREVDLDGWCESFERMQGR